VITRERERDEPVQSDVVVVVCDAVSVRHPVYGANSFAAADAT